MAEFILHHYPQSPFSEKARALLNARQLPWRSVIIPMIMPRPDTIPLTGGYRRTPVLQVGADIHCDTALIAAFLDDKGEGATWYPPATRAAAQTLARWADTELFWAAVTLMFQPSTAGSFLGDASVAAAFAKDRAAFNEGATIRGIPLQEAQPRYQVFLAELNAQLADGRRYLFGADWTIADFSVYHIVWFVHGNPGLKALLAPHAAVSVWFDRMRTLAAPAGKEMSGEEAIQVALAAAPASVQGVSDLPDISLGAIVDVGPSDYGVMPSRGALVKCDEREIVIARSHERTGPVQVHFPRLGFRVRKAEG